MLRISPLNRFKKDLKKAAKRGWNLDKLESVIDALAKGQELGSKFRPHPLQGQWKPAYECHVEPDWLLIYEVTATELILIRTGTHSDLF